MRWQKSVPLTVEGLLARGAGGDGNEDAGMSSDKIRKIRIHRKPKVS